MFSRSDTSSITNAIEKENLSAFQNCGESVTSVQGGVLGTPGFEEIVATTYSGMESLVKCTNK